MAPLLPSEVARLVYGQLERCNCSSVAERFLNQSPHLEECREFVKKVGKPSFMTKAYGLTLQQILERYLDMWNLIIDQTNEFIPDTQDKFADPVDALKFLLSAYDKTSSEVGNMLLPPNDTRWKSITNDVETSSNFSLRINSSPDTVRKIPNESVNPNHSPETGYTPTHTLEDDEVEIIEQNGTKKQACLLDKLYASTESSENSGKKKKLKMLMPRTQFSDRSAVAQSATNPTSSENEVATLEASHNTEEIVHTDKNCESSKTSRTKVSEVNLSKRINMQLRSSSKISDGVNCEPNSKDCRVSRKRKCCSPEREGGVLKQSKISKSVSGKENDAQVDFTKIPQLLMDDPKWPELIAENINKKILESPQKKIDTLVEDEEIQSIAEKTMEDDLTDEFIRGLLNCAQTITQDKVAEAPDISLLDENPYDTSLLRGNGLMNGISSNAEAASKPTFEFGESSDSTSRNIGYTKLREDMTEFMRFNSPKKNNLIPHGPQDYAILIDVAETEHISTQNCDTNNYVIEEESRSIHSGFVVCSTQEPSLSTGSNPKDEIITIGSNMNNVEWNVKTTTPITIPAAHPTPNTTLQIRGPISSSTTTTKKLRLIAPKPDTPVEIAPIKKTLPNNSKGTRKSRK